MDDRPTVPTHYSVISVILSLSDQLAGCRRPPGSLC